MLVFGVIGFTLTVLVAWTNWRTPRKKGGVGQIAIYPGVSSGNVASPRNPLYLSHNRRYRKMRVTEATRFSARKTTLSTHVGEP
jgi:hypothetical protein